MAKAYGVLQDTCKVRLVM